MYLITSSSDLLMFMCFLFALIRDTKILFSYDFLLLEYFNTANSTHEKNILDSAGLTESSAVQV